MRYKVGFLWALLTSAAAGAQPPAYDLQAAGGSHGHQLLLPSWLQQAHTFVSFTSPCHSPPVVLLVHKSCHG